MSRHLPRRAAVLAAAALAGAAALGPTPPARATRDEATGLRVTKEAAGVRLQWQAPAAGADTHVVRRCPLRSLGISPGACVVQGLTETTWLDEDGAGSAFYIPTGVSLGAEGSLGAAFDGHDLLPRVAPDCSSPPDPTPVLARVRVVEPLEICGTQVRVTFPPELELVAWRCTDLMAGALAQGALEQPGRAIGICAPSDSSVAPGVIGEVELRAGACRVSAAEVALFSCEYVDCVSFATLPVACELLFP